MPLVDYRGKAVLITGGTMGIGLATGLAFARQGARVTLTYKWGSADHDAVRRKFTDAGYPEPRLLEADAGQPEDTANLLAALRAEHDAIEVLVSNVSNALIVKGVEDYQLRSLHRSVDYSAWPFFSYPRAIKETFGRYPRYVIGLSSGGPDWFYKNYDFVAASKALMETLCRYLNYRLQSEDVRFNVVRSRLVPTESLRATFGRDFEDFVQQFNMRDQFIACEEVAGAILALASGLMDAYSGQVLMVDRGTTFCDNVMRLYNEQDKLDLPPLSQPDRRA